MRSGIQYTFILMDTNLCTIYLVRHGQSEGNVKRLMQGHKDYPLTQKGEEQARETGKILSNVHFDAVFSSDLLRAKRTAEIIALEKKLAVLTTQALRERTFGKFEDVSYDDFDKLFAKHHTIIESLEQSKQLSYRYHKEIETDEEVMSRFITFVREIAVAYPDKTILLVSHGGLIFSLLAHLGVADRKQIHEGMIKNAAYVKLQTDGVEFTIKEIYNIEQVTLPTQPNLSG